MTATCPVCQCEQAEGLLCHADTSHLERELGDVAAIVAELDVTLSRQDRIPSSSGGGESDKAKSEDSGLAPLKHTRSPVNWGASTVADDLQNTLTTWARDVWAVPDVRYVPEKGTTAMAARTLLMHIDHIRRHPAVVELFDEVTDAIAQARRAVDRPGNRTIIFVGPCPETRPEGGICDGEVYAFIPTEDDRPSRLECRTSKEHKWSAVQWLRAGKRILDRIEERKREKRGAA